LEQAADAIIFVTEAGEPIQTHRQQDASVTGELLQLLLQYARGELHQAGKPPIPLQEITRIIVSGSSSLQSSLLSASQSFLKPYLVKEPSLSASVYWPMHTMLNGVFA